jgi:hypothetical protein
MPPVRPCAGIGHRVSMERVSTERPQSHRPRRPALFGPAALESVVGGEDPAQRAEAAHLTAAALLRHGRAADPEETARLVALADVHGIDEVALLWAGRPADTLPGALWRIYALRAGIRADPVGMSRSYDAGRARAEVDAVVAGAAQPPGPEQLLELADAILTGLFSGDLAVALERAAAFCRVVSTGSALLADVEPEPAANRVTRRAADLARTAAQLEHAATLWRLDSLH